MSRRGSAGVGFGLSIALGLAASAGCGRSPPPSLATKPKPSEVAPYQVKLLKEAEARLGIPAGLSTVERRSLPVRRLYAGEVIPVPGHAALITAPQAGTVIAVEANGKNAAAALPVLGERVRAGQALCALAPLLAVGERAQVATVLAESEAQVARARVQEQTAALALSRAERLVKEGLAGAKLLEEAQAQRELCQATLRAAQSQFQSLSGSGAVSLVGAVPIRAPIDGTLREIRVAPHQQILAGTPLFELASRERLWVRASISSGEAAQIDPAPGALVLPLVRSQTAAAEKVETPQLAPSVQPSPETARPDVGTLDLYFALPNGDRFRLGQRVAVWIAEQGTADAWVLPAAALLYDGGGETFVYEQVEPQTFKRQRVEVLRVDGELALLRESSLRPGGLRSGSRVVTAGAMELYGAELGVGK